VRFSSGNQEAGIGNSNHTAPVGRPLPSEVSPIRSEGALITRAGMDYSQVDMPGVRYKFVTLEQLVTPNRLRQRLKSGEIITRKGRGLHLPPPIRSEGGLAYLSPVPTRSSFQLKVTDAHQWRNHLQVVREPFRWTDSRRHRWLLRGMYKLAILNRGIQGYLAHKKTPSRRTLP
jgi:hypothetical protein